jgi:hypothetical protein
MGGSRVQGVRSPFRPNVPFFVEECNFQTKLFRRKGTRSLHKTKMFPRKGTRSLHKTKIFLQKKSFFATRKNVESYSQMPGKRISALEISKSRPRSVRPRRVCPFSEIAPPFQKSWIRP